MKRPTFHKLRRLLSLGETEAAASEWATQCLNCGAQITSAFCPDCGQRALPPNPTMRELAGDAVTELSGWDGKFIDTFHLLLTKPGELTRRFIEGQRVRYIAPVRLYLTLSVVYFLIASSTPINPTTKSNIHLTLGDADVQIVDPGKDAQGKVSQAGAPNADSKDVLTKQQRDSANAQIARMPRMFRPALRKAVADPVAFKHAFLENMPRALFALLPVFAGILALFYWRRNYPEHLYFALHIHSFVFLVLGASALFQFSGNIAVIQWSGTLLALTIPIYGVMAARRVYGGSIAATIAKGIGVTMIYGAASIAALTAVAVLTGFAG